MIDKTEPKKIMSAHDFARLGEGKVAYIRSMTSDQFHAAFPDVEALPAGLNLWALLNADGAPIVIGDSREALIANAWEHELQPVSVH
tara:strand:+ start:683 stop:943 length:261 start_codon:yes stop_codon:yes gene_type:complete